MTWCNRIRQRGVGGERRHADGAEEGAAADAAHGAGTAGGSGREGLSWAAAMLRLLMPALKARPARVSLVEAGPRRRPWAAPFYVLQLFKGRVNS
jgi:hypothetical protein